MADDHGIVSFGREGTICFVGDGHIVQRCAAFEGELWDNGDVLVGNECDEGVLGLIGGLQAICDGRE